MTKERIKQTQTKKQQIHKLTDKQGNQRTNTVIKQQMDKQTQITNEITKRTTTQRQTQKQTHKQTTI